MESRLVPALLPAIALVAGAACGLHLPWAPPGLAVALAGAGATWRGRLGGALAAAALGLLAARVGPPPELPAGIDPGRPVAAVGVVADHWRADGEEASVRFRIERLRQGDGRRAPVVARAAMEVRLVAAREGELPPPGSTLRVKGALRRSPGFANAVATPPGPWRLRVKSRRLIDELAAPGPAGRLSARLRGRVEAAYAAAAGVTAGGEGDGHRARESAATDQYAEPAGGHGVALARALVLADTSDLPESWQRGLRRTGLAHVMAVSGLHVGLVAGIAMLAGVWLPWRARLVVALAAIAGYLLLAGPRPSLLRAALMGGLAALALLSARVPSGANALAVAAAALVLARPSLLDDLGFRLTVTATAGILFLAPALARRWGGAGNEVEAGRPGDWSIGGGGGAPAADGRNRSTKGRASAPPSTPSLTALADAVRSRRSSLLVGPFSRLRRLFAPALAATVAAQLASLPVAAPAFHLLSLGSPLVNLLAVPWTAVALAASLVWTAAALADPALAAALLPVLDLVAAPFGWPALAGPERWGTIAVAAPAWVALAVAALLAGWLLAPLRRLPLLALALVLVPAFRWGGEGPPRHGGLEAVFLDVGQGDAILLRDGPRALLVDGGGWPSGDLGGRVLVPALVGEGVGRLDAVLLTHPDRDHCRGLVDLASYLPIAELWLARGLPRTGCAGELTAAVEGQGGAVVEVAAGERRRLGRWRLAVLHPPPADGDSEHTTSVASPGDNDASVVLLAEAAGRRLLLTGDVEADAERRLLREHGDALAAEVLKLAHHGSKSSTGAPFLAAVAPRLAIASAGLRNPYGHPADEVRRRLARRRVPLLRTDRHGMVHLTLAPPGGVQPAAAPRPLRLRLGRLQPVAEPPS